MIKLPLICPVCKSDVKKINQVFLCKNKKCSHNKRINGFLIVKSIPVMISENETDTVCAKNSIKSYIKRSPTKLRKLFKKKNYTTKKNCEKFIRHITLNKKKPKVLIIGGAEKGHGTDKLWNNKNIEIHSTDIYMSENVHFICDSHYLCLKTNYYDGVWIQAVLEHVVEPNIVVNEIYRVLKPGGLVYAETPFMQQVHEGAYDFNRYTVLGHRYLFKNFKLIDYGGNKGPEEVFTWSTKYLIWSIFRNKTFANFISFFVSIIMIPLNLLISEKSMHDASSGVYFLGKKAKNYKITHKELVNLYKGQYLN